jgi:hypothetical protein
MPCKSFWLLLAAPALCISLFGQIGTDETAVRSKIVGTWKLLLTENTLKDGSKTHDYGPNGKGFLIYSNDGYMCAELMDPDRPKWKNPDQPTQEEKASAFDDSAGYCGRYQIDTKHHLLVHLPEVSSAPSYVGSRQIRQYRFEGGLLILSGGPVEDEPDLASWKLVWERVR